MKNAKKDKHKKNTNEKTKTRKTKNGAIIQTEEI